MELEAKELIKTIRERNGDATVVDGGKLSIKPKSVLTPEEYEWVGQHVAEMLAELTGFDAVTFEAKGQPTPRVSPEMWITRIDTHTLAKSGIWHWPDRVLRGHGDPKGHKSLLEVITEMGGNVRLDIANMYAFSISGTRLADDGVTELGDFTFDRWAYSKDEYKCGDKDRERRYASMRKGA
jgi:hypothetical protein